MGNSARQILLPNWTPEAVREPDIIPAANDRFVVMPGGTPVTLLQFGKAASGRDQLRVAPVGKESASQVFERISVPPPASWRESLAGRYRSDELDVTYTVEARPGGLLIHPVGRPDINVPRGAFVRVQ
jgi:hypothetical protein